MAGLWTAAPIPAVLSNRRYSFLIGVQRAPPGWECSRSPTGSADRSGSGDPRLTRMLCRTGRRDVSGQRGRQMGDRRFLLDMCRPLIPVPLGTVLPFGLLSESSKVQLTGLLLVAFLACQATRAPERPIQVEAAHRLGEEC